MLVLTLAFATARHAHHAIGFLRACDVAFDAGEVSGGADGDFATFDVQVSISARSRLLTLVAGVNGLVVAEQAGAGVTSGIVAVA